MPVTVLPQDQTFWYLQRPEITPLQGQQQTEIVVLGGGIAGLTTAQAFAKRGKRVILLEALYCGAGATGKSSGFITANGELSLAEFVHRYGQTGAQAIWQAINELGRAKIRQNIIDYQIDCDYTPTPALAVASTAKDVTLIQQEAADLAKFGYATQLLNRTALRQILNTDQYFGGVTYPDSFGINPYKYCQALRTHLLAAGVKIYEETPALAIDGHQVKTPLGTVTAEQIIVCTDRFIPQLQRLTTEIFQFQNFLLVSSSLTPATIKQIFPQQPYMVWDTELVYNFYRLTGDRLLLGGGALAYAYRRSETYHNQYLYHKLVNYFKRCFPAVELQFTQLWPGLIGVSPDIAPITGRDRSNPAIYYIGAAAGLSIATMLGNYCAAHILDGADQLQDYFSPERKFPFRPSWQRVLGKPLTFALSHWLRHKCC